MFMKVLEDLYKATEDCETVDVLVRVGKEKILRLHGMMCGVQLDKPTEAVIVFNPTASGNKDEIQWDSIIDLIGQGATNHGWITR
jgi:hypothetical protein